MSSKIIEYVKRKFPSLIRIPTVSKSTPMKSLEEKISSLLATGNNSKNDEPLILGHVKEFTQEEMEIIFGYKAFISQGIIYLTAPSLPHQYMEGCLATAFNKKINEKSKFSAQFVMGIRLWGKFSCGLVKYKLPDVCIVEDCGTKFSIPIIGEVAFGNETLRQLIIQAGEILSESTNVVYSIGFKIWTTAPFRCDFYLFKRIIQPDKKLIAQLESSKNLETINGCSLVDPEIMAASEVIENVNVETVLHHEITEENYINGFSFEIEGRFLGSLQQMETVTITGEMLIRLRRLFYDHMGITINPPQTDVAQDSK